ncbi:helix-turn-helix transcriptional regulator [Brachybacterium saurashtrense]|nr:LuxR C-terminal-related transcriptional regulator [Brachybacterium saurashtrense]
MDTSAPLLFMEAIYGSGKRTVLRQWEDRGGSRYGEIRLRFSARRLPRDELALARMLWEALRHRLDRPLADLPEEDGLVEAAALGELRRLRRPVTLAIHAAEVLDESVFGLLLDLLGVGVRLIIAGNDLSEFMRSAQRREVYYWTLGDRELWLSREEARHLVEEQGVALTEEALTELYGATLGHPGMILSSLATLPVETSRGLVTRDRAISAFLAEEPLGRWGTEFADFLAATVLLPRFTLAEATALARQDFASRYMSRMLELGLGRMVWHPRLHERVFRWDEHIRLVIRRSMPHSAEGTAEAVERIRLAARDCGDEELLMSSLVSTGDLDGAEELLRESIWDLLPNASAPMWEALERLSPLALTERPALLSARLRLSPHRRLSPVSARAAHRAGRLAADAAETADPWARLGGLVHAITFALYAGERERLIDLFARARTLAGDLVGSEALDAVGGRQVSELLLLAETTFRSGNAIPAAEIARLAIQLLEGDPVGLDPRGERLAFARLLVLHDHRARGLEDPYDPAPLLTGLRFLWRDGDIAVAAMTLMWGDFDDGDFEAADAHLLAASRRLADPEAWPLLALMRAHMAVYRKSSGELEEFVSAFERGTLSEPGEFAQQSLSQMRRITDYLGHKVGRPLPSPGYLPATPEGGRTFYPRTEFTVHLMEALYALRAERPEAARLALSKAVGLTPHRAIGLYTLANASAQEVRGLCALAEEVPGGSRLRLEKALRFAGDVQATPIDLSEREREVLGHLREGATNREMAQALFISVNTVKFHRANLMRKLEATSREKLLQRADTLGV